MARYPELRWLHKFEQLPAVALALACLLVAGWSGLVVGFFWSTVFVYHATFSINSLAHGSGSRRYVTGDDSRNNWLLALFTMGEGWHNNHHACQSSVRQGFRWWEIDPTYYVLWVLSGLGIVWKLKTPPATVLRNEQRLGARVEPGIGRKSCEERKGRQRRNHSWAWEHSWPLWSFRKEGFDLVSGLDLLRAAEVLPVKPMRIGTAQELAEKTPVVVAGSGGIEAAQPAVVGRPAERGRMLG